MVRPAGPWSTKSANAPLEDPTNTRFKTDPAGGVSVPMYRSISGSDRSRSSSARSLVRASRSTTRSPRSSMAQLYCTRPGGNAHTECCRRSWESGTRGNGGGGQGISGLSIISSMKSGTRKAKIIAPSVTWRW